MESTKAQLGSGLRTKKQESVAKVMEPAKTLDLFMDHVLSINEFIQKRRVYQKTNPDLDTALSQLDVYDFLVDLCRKLLTTNKGNPPSEKAWYLLEEVLKLIKADDQVLHLSSSLRPFFNSWCRLNGIQAQPNNSDSPGSKDPPKQCQAVEDSRPVKSQGMATSEGDDSESGDAEGKGSEDDDKSEDSEKSKSDDYKSADSEDSKSKDSESETSEDQESESNTDSGESSDSEPSPSNKGIQITIEDQERVRKLVQGPLNQVLVSKFRLQVSRADLRSLYGSNWLNDNVINFYMELLNQRAQQHVGQLPSAHAMNSFFLTRLLATGYATVRRWTRNIDLFSKKIIAVPVHQPGDPKHWTMAIIHMGDKAIRYYDSMGGSNNGVLKSLETYLHMESLDKRKEPFDLSDFKLETVKNVPRQYNGNDCGVFCCAFAEYITRDAPLTFEQKDMACLRNKMILEIADGQLRS